MGAGLTLLVLFLGAPPASAHAVLTSSNPAQGAVVSSAPEEVVLSFSEGVSMSDDSIRVLGPEGDRADTGGPRDVGQDGETSYAVSLRSGLPDGTYTVAWQTVSADSHPISGAFTFSVGAPSQTTVDPDQPAAGGGLVGALYHVGRYAAYAGFVLLVGGGAFVLTCWPAGSAVRSVRRVVTVGWMTLAGSTLALLLLRSPYTGSGKLADALDLGALQEVLGTKTGTALLCRLLLVAAAALFASLLFSRRFAGRARTAPGDGSGSGDTGTAAGGGSSSVAGGRTDGGRTDGGRATGERSPEERRDLAFGLASGGLLVSVGLATTWAMAEHASTGIQPRLAMPVDVLHLLAVAVWLGGLVTLLTALHRGPLVPVEVVRRFSRIAFGSVVVLAATGLYQSWRQVGSWSALVLTDFGQLLLVKIGLIAVLVGFASLSRGWTAELLSPPRDGEEDGPADGTDRGDRTDEEPAPALSVPRSADEAPHAEGAAPIPTGAAHRGPTDRRPPNRNAPDPDPDVAPDADRDPDRGPALAADVDPGQKPDADTDDAGAPDPVRAAQLARQREARTRARKRQERERARDADPVRSGLRRSVLGEAGVALVVLLVTTMLTTTEPGRTEETARPAGQQENTRTDDEPVSLDVPFDTGGPSGQGTARVQLTPGATGTNALHIRLQGPNGRPLDVPEVRATLTRTETGIGPLSAALRRVGPGHWTASGVQLPMAGQWELALTVRTSDVDQVTEKREVRIG